MKLCLLSVWCTFAAWTALAADDPYAASVFQKNCATCHASPSQAARIPQLDALKKLTPITILRTLETGVMKAQAAQLSTYEREGLANYLGKAVTTQRQRDELANTCPAGPPWKNSPSWASWAPGLTNARFQSAAAAGLSAADVPRLAPKWVFAFPDTSVLRSQPAVYRGRVFAGAQDGSLYALDAATGCVHWVTMVQAEVRSGITVAEVAGRPTVFFGDSAGFIYALDGETGKQIWKLQPDEHPASKATATPVFYRGRLYVGISSLEEALAVSPNYVCCTFRGSESALDAATGKVVWKRYLIAEAAKPRSKTRRGAATAGPSGAGVWNAATLDPEHDTLYIGTGDNYSDPVSPMSDAIVALKMSTGEILWSHQFTKDAWNSSCYLEDKTSCPDSDGPDFDFAESPILITLPNGKRALVVGQKSGIAYGLDPERKGQVMWQSRLGKGGTVGGIQWGSATDGRNMYAALSDIEFKNTRINGGNDAASEVDSTKGGGIFALRVDNGERIWQTPPPGCGNRRPCSPAQSAAVTVIPGVVFSSSLDGHLRGYSTADGKIIWDYDTAREFKTVNGVPGQGGAMDVGGPIVAGGMLFVSSGYARRSLMPGNVLIAFGVAP
ncbi:MAG TPA: PQQ-binding-like beta-propeller repeat protein [Bryobacteraceae bacterium]|nr:PQQ-binding-like beta-propeller repeat protein [Bryobacteraceae bacterium]